MYWDKIEFVKFVEFEIRLLVARKVGKGVYFGVLWNALQLGSDSDFSIPSSLKLVRSSYNKNFAPKAH